MDELIRDEIARRLRYGIREATDEEQSYMTEEQRWHYNASVFKPIGLHFDFFRHNKCSVRPVTLHLNGKIDFAHMGASGTAIKAHLRRIPIQFFQDTSETL